MATHTGDITFTVKVTNVTGTINTKIQYGAWRGAAYATDGYEWNDIVTTDQDTTYKVSIKTKAWNQDEAYPFFKIRVYENGNQSNEYYISHVMWRKQS